jgi:hypothetical protein
LPVRVDHRGIRRDHLQSVLGLTDGNILSIFISSEIGNAIPFGTFTVNLSCAATAMPPKTANKTANKTASDTAMITIAGNGVRFMAHSCALSCKSNWSRPLNRHRRSAITFLA